ncbi:MAG: hypothetical protein IJS29_10110 [Selenomonadaceae bacterium]|nr:hypothetical protein [Selenomonadaceae bacterium]
MLKIGYFGDGIWAQLALKKILSNANFSIKFVVLRYDNPDEILKDIAEKENIPCFQIKNVNAAEFLEVIKKFDVDINVSMSFNQILKRDIINLAPKKFINCHAGALPFYRGRNILNWALINGEKEFGVTVHFVDEGIDTGDIILQNFYPISIQDRYSDLLTRAQIECANTLYQALLMIHDNNFEVTSQEKIHKVGFYCSARKIGDEYINWNWTSERIYNFVRGISEPAPGARTFFDGKEYIIDRAELIENAPCYIDKTGNIVGKMPRGIVVKTGDSTILLTRLIEISTNKELNLSKLKIGQNFYNANILRGLENMGDKSVILIGGGGHAKVLLDILLEQGANILGILDNNKAESDAGGGGGRYSLYEIPVIGTDEDISNYNPNEIKLVNGIGSVNGVDKRFKLYTKFKNLGYNFRTVIHSKSVVSSKVILCEGVQVMAGAIINIGSYIDENSVSGAGSTVIKNIRQLIHSVLIQFVLTLTLLYSNSYLL